VLAGQLAPVTGQVRLARLDGADSLGAKVWAKGEVRVPRRDAPVAFLNVYDGAMYRSLREADRTLVEGTPEAGGRALFSDGADGVLLEPLLDPEPFKRELACGLSEGGESEVGGVRCTIVEVRMPASSSYGKARWHIGVDDRLPRRVEMIYSFGAETGVQTTSITNLKPGAVLGEDEFSVGLPEGYTRKTLEQSSTLLAIGAPAPAWELRDPSGTVHRLADLKGRIVVMDFWATWCGPCRASMPAVQKVHERFKDRGVAVFGVDFKDKGDAGAYMREKGYTYTLLLDGDAAGASYGVEGIPVFYVIGADGKVAYRHRGGGENTESELAGAVEAALAAAGR
jgi:peroxiredoxin